MLQYVHTIETNNLENVCRAQYFWGFDSITALISCLRTTRTIYSALLSKFQIDYVRQFCLNRQLCSPDSAPAADRILFTFPDFNHT